eukprot:SAG31_NODE_745_length_12408_cov_4.755057_1_plen_562_part_00
MFLNRCSAWGERDPGDAECQHGLTYSDAEAFCARVGGRLCTAEELEAGCTQGTGCQHDSDLLWSSTPGGEPTIPTCRYKATRPPNSLVNVWFWAYIPEAVSEREIQCFSIFGGSTTLMGFLDMPVDSMHPYGQAIGTTPGWVHCGAWDGGRGFRTKIAVRGVAIAWFQEPASLPQPLSETDPGRSCVGGAPNHCEALATCGHNCDTQCGGIWFEGTDLDLAAGRPATSSSVAWGGVASRAVDGQTSGNFVDGQTCTHTDENGRGVQWWQVDLGGTHEIGPIHIYHRTDAPYQDRLVGAEVVVSATDNFNDGEVCEFLDEAGAQPEVVQCSGRAGRFVTVASNTGNPLTLCEVEVRTPRVLLVSIDVVDGQIVFGGSASYEGVTIGSPSIVAGPTGEVDAILFTGSTDQLQLGTETGVDTDASWTVDCYFKTPIPQGSSWHTLTRGAGGDHQVIINPDQTSLGSYDNVGGGGFSDTGFDITSLADGWHRLTVAAGEGTATFYVDGSAVGSHSVVSESDFFAIGNYQGGGQPWGYMYGFRIYDGAIPPSELEDSVSREVGGGH